MVNVLTQVYDGLSYKLVLEFPNGYPYKAPMVKFDTPCYHPNVDMSGNICLDILKEKWSALYDVRTILLSIQSLLAGDCFFLTILVLALSCSEYCRQWIACVIGMAATCCSNASILGVTVMLDSSLLLCTVKTKTMNTETAFLA